MCACPRDCASATNWLPALRRAYNRRLRSRDDNPFLEWIKVPIPSDRRSIKSGTFKPVAPATASPPIAPLDATSETLNKSEAAEAAEQAEQEQASVQEMEDWFDKQVEVDWAQVDVDTQIQALYNACEWHMQDPERFRRHLKWDDEVSWVRRRLSIHPDAVNVDGSGVVDWPTMQRIEPVGLDRSGNKYYSLDDGRLWIQRAPPPFTAALNQHAASRTTDGTSSPAHSASDDQSSPQPASASTTSAKAERLASGEAVSKKPRTYRNRRDAEEWESIPDELKKEWEKGATESTRNTNAASGATASHTTSDVASATEAAPTNGHASNGAHSTAGETHDEEDPKLPGGLTERGKRNSVEETMEKGQLDWETAFWKERHRIEHLEGFIEWETVCVSLDDWKRLSEAFAKTRNATERKFHNWLVDTAIPTLEVTTAVSGLVSSLAGPVVHPH